MITPAYVRLMAAYNAEMNRRVYAAAGRIADAARRADRGVFWKSLHGTLCHLVWADRIWMHRFEGWPRPAGRLAESGALFDDFDLLAADRAVVDAGMQRWAEGVDEAWLAQELVWTSGSAGREMRHGRSLIVAHLFNHQTHHRGQAHALITACGEDTGDTDLWLVVEDPDAPRLSR